MCCREDAAKSNWFAVLWSPGPLILTFGVELARALRAPIERILS